MTTELFMDQIKAFGARLGLPKVDVDKLVDIQLKNIDALGRSAQAAGDVAKALADKQREIMEAAFKETSAMVRDFHPVGDPQGTLAKQKDYAKRAFELTMQNTRDVAELTKKTTTDATAIVRDRLRESLTELRDSVVAPGAKRRRGWTTRRDRKRPRNGTVKAHLAPQMRIHRKRRTRGPTRRPIGLAQKKERTSLPP